MISLPFLGNRVSRTSVKGFWSFLLAIWFVAMTLLPISLWVWGDRVVAPVITFVLLVQFCVVFVILCWSVRPRGVLWMFFVSGCAAWFFEFLGSSVGFPFGVYDYTNSLIPQLGGVPLLIPLAWFMMLPSAWAVASLISTRRYPLAPVSYVLFSALAITAWDLFLDPLMVGWGFWVWEPARYAVSSYFGIPWVNYAGWVLTGSVITALVRPWRFELPAAPLLTIYGLTWLLQSLGLALFWGHPGAALVGFVVMGGLFLAAARTFVHRSRSTHASPTAPESVHAYD